MSHLRGPCHIKKQSCPTWRRHVKQNGRRIYGALSMWCIGQGVWGQEWRKWTVVKFDLGIYSCSLCWYITFIYSFSLCWYITFPWQENRPLTMGLAMGNWKENKLLTRRGMWNMGMCSALGKGVEAIYCQRKMAGSFPKWRSNVAQDGDVYGQINRRFVTHVK